MVREYPDLNIFNNFSPENLFIPLDKNIARVGKCLGIFETVSNLRWNDVVKILQILQEGCSLKTQ